MTNEITDSDIALALKWLQRGIIYAEILPKLSCKQSGGYIHIARTLREAHKRGLLVVKKR